MLSTTFFKLLLPLALMETVTAAPGPTIPVQICRDSTTNSNSTGAALVDGPIVAFDVKTNQTLEQQAWVPDCSQSGTPDAAAWCTSCQELAVVTWTSSIQGCPSLSADCAYGSVACGQSCAAAAIYLFFNGLKNCFCKDADCIAKGIPNSDPVARRINLGGAIFAVRMDDGFAPSGNDWLVDNPLEAAAQCTYEGTGSLEAIAPAIGFLNS